MMSFTAFVTESKLVSMHPDDTKTERPMVMSGSPAETMIEYSAGRMPLDNKKVKAIEKVIKSGKKLVPKHKNHVG